ncbi:MAG: histidine phosphatase family protein, partial [Actinomycetota bacterium]|nr:histidine phosphatase family protein [Actinomycetota bacterium]
ELGATVAVTRRLVRADYTVAGTPKTVAYWAMRFVNGAFVVNDEVDEVRWEAPAKARKLLSYDSERAVLADFTSLPVPDAVVVLVRHARAGKRRDWKDADDLRPLDETGTDQSLHLAQTLRHFRPEQIISAEPTRCIQTMQPLAALLGLPVQIDPVFGDASFERSRSATQTALMSLAKPGRVVVVCSQGVTIPSLIERLSPGVRHSETRKGACWVLSIVDGDVVSVDYYDPTLLR